MQLLKGRKPTFVTHLLERTCSLSSIFHLDHLIRERHLVFQERRYSLQSNTLDCSFYVVDLYYRSLVKLRQESQIPLPFWRGPSRREHSPKHPTNTPLHIQLPQKVTDSYKLVCISHPARGDSNSGEHSPADSKGADIHSGPALRKAHSLEHIDIKARRDPASREHSLVKHSGAEDFQGPAHSLKGRIAHKESHASRGPDSRDHSTAKPSRDIDDSIAHSSTHRTAHKSNPASGGHDSREHSTAHPSGLSNPSGKTEQAFVKGHHPPRYTSDHPPPTPSKSKSKHSVLAPEQRKCILTLVRSIKKRKTDTKPTKESELITSETPSKHKSIESKDLPLTLLFLVRQWIIPPQHLHHQKI